MGVPFAHPYFICLMPGAFSQITAMMALAVFFNRKTSLTHGLHHQNISNNRHHSGRSRRSHSQQTNLIRMTCSQTNISGFRQRTIRISRNDNLFQFGFRRAASSVSSTISLVFRSWKSRVTSHSFAECPNHHAAPRWDAKTQKEFL